MPVGLAEPGQAIRLNAGDWTAYSVNSLEAKSSALTVRAKAESAPAEFQLSVNGDNQNVAADGPGWVEFKLKPVNLIAGTNQVKLSVKIGSVGFDWLEFQ